MRSNGKQSTSSTLITAERRRKIYDWVLRNGSVNVSELAEAFGVRTQTIRNDLDALQSEGKLVRSYGGAVIKDPFSSSLPYSEVRGTRMEQKAGIGQAALAYLPQASSVSVFLDSGSTAYQLAVRMPENQRLRIATNSPETANYLASKTAADVLLLGGRMLPESLATDMTASRDTLEQLYYSVAFMSAAGIDIKRGITDSDQVASENLKLIMEHSGQVVMLCDSSKFGRISYARTGPVSLIDVLITDDEADAEFVRQLREEGVEVVAVGPNDSARTASA